MSEPWNPTPPPPPMDPPGGYMPPPPMNSGNALAKVQGPAIGLMVVAGISILLALLGLAASLFGFGQNAMNFGQGNEQMARYMSMFAGTLGVVFRLLGLASNGFILWAAMQMKSLKGWQLSVVASVLAMIPCFTCYLIGIPIGIWALVVLLKPEVKSAFTA